MADFLKVAVYPHLQPVSALGRHDGDGLIDNMLGRLGVPRRRGTWGRIVSGSEKAATGAGSLTGATATSS